MSITQQLHCQLEIMF